MMQKVSSEIRIEAMAQLVNIALAIHLGQDRVIEWEPIIAEAITYYLNKSVPDFGPLT
jgi:hypothetical protein